MKLARSFGPLALVALTSLAVGCGLKYGQNGSHVGGQKTQGAGDDDDSTEAKPKTKTTGAKIPFAQAKENEDYQALARICADEDDEDQEAACKLAKNHAKHELGMSCPAKSLSAELTDADTGAATPMRNVYVKQFRKEYLDKMAACGNWDILFKGAIVAVEPDDYDRFVADSRDVMAAFEKWIDTHANLGNPPADVPKKEEAYPLGYLLTWLARNNAAALAPKVVVAAKGTPLYVKVSVLKFAQVVKYGEGAMLARDLLDDADPQKRAKGCQLLADIGDTQSFAKVKALADADPTQTHDHGTTTFPVRTACLSAATKLDPKNQPAPPPTTSGSARPGNPPPAGSGRPPAPPAH